MQTTCKIMLFQPVVVEQKKRSQALLLKTTESQWWWNERRNILLCNRKPLVKVMVSGKKDNWLDVERFVVNVQIYISGN